MNRISMRSACIALCLAMVLMFAACSSSQNTTVAASNSTITEPSVAFTGDISDENAAEVKLAKEAGLIPEAMAGDYSDPVSMGDMCELALRAVERFYDTTVEPDLSVFSEEQLNPPVTRIEEAVILTETVRAAIGEYPAYNGDPARPKELTDHISLDDVNIYEGSPSQTARVRLWGSPEDTVSVVSALFATRQVDQISGKPLMELDASYKFNSKKTVTQLEAILAAFRLYRSLDPLPEYLSLQDVPKHSIAKELYSDENILPDASNQVIPQWHGVQYCPRGYSTAQSFGAYNDSCYRESDFQAMRNAGLNMVAIYISPTRLAWPYQKDDLNQVNEVELEKLDQAIGWAFENGLHVQLSFNDVPTMEGRYDFYQSHNYGLLFDDADTAQLFSDMWRMISRRYADIPNRYLGFTLLNEVDAPNDEDYLRVFEPAIDAIWEESPERLIIADIHSQNITGESMAAKGVALSRHQYALPLLDYTLNGEDGGGLMDLYPHYEQELTWPQIYMPSFLHDSGNTITFQSDFKAGELVIGVNQIADGGETLIVKIDGTPILSEEVKPRDQINWWNMQKVDREYSVAIPEGAKEITLYNQNSNGIIALNRIKISQNGQDDIILYPYDAFNINWEPESVTIQLGENGSLEGNRFITWDDLKRLGGNISYDGIKAMAEKYNVGFFVGEFGPFGEYGLPRPVMEGYLNMMMQGMQDDGVGWSNGSFSGKGQLITNRPQDDSENTFEQIPGSPYYFNVSMRDLYQKYTPIN